GSLNFNRHSTNISRILALDLGKFNSVACVYERATHEHRFTSVQTTPQMIHDLLLKHQSKITLDGNSASSSVRNCVSNPDPAGDAHHQPAAASYCASRNEAARPQLDEGGQNGNRILNSGT